MDRITDHTLRLLSRDGRISNLDLAERVGPSPSTCLRRAQQLKRRGVVRGCRAVFDWARLGVGFAAYVTVGLNPHTRAGQQACERAMARAPTAVDCHNIIITGAVEYLLGIEVADLPAWKSFHTDVLGTLPQVNAITSCVVMGSPTDARA